MTIRRLLAIALCCLTLASPAICYAINTNVIQARNPAGKQNKVSQQIKSLIKSDSVTHLAIYRRTIYFGANKLSEGYQAIAVDFHAGVSYFVTIGENQIWMSQVLGALPNNLETKAQELFGAANDCPDGHNNGDGPLIQVWDQHDKIITQFALGTYFMVGEGDKETPLVTLANKMAQSLAGDPVTPIVMGFKPNTRHVLLLERHVDGRVILWKAGWPVLFIAAGSSTAMWSTERVKYGVDNKPKDYLPPHDNAENSPQPWATTGMPGPCGEGPTDENTADENTTDDNRMRICNLLNQGK